MGKQIIVYAYEPFCRAYIESVLLLDVNMRIWIMFSENTCRMKNCLVLAKVAKLNHKPELKIFTHTENPFYLSSN